MTKKTTGERELVLGILMEVLENGQYSHIVLRDVLSKYQYLDKKERAFITRVSEGTIERKLELDYILDQFSKVKVNKMKPVIRNILRSAVYQFKYMESVPDSAVCNEAVKLAVKKGFGNLRGFVNGVLRNVARNLDQIQYPKEPVKRLSVQYSMPEWIVRLWLESYGIETVEKMLEDFLKEKPLTVRVKAARGAGKEEGDEPSHTEVLRDDFGGWQAKMEAEGVKVLPHPYLPYAFFISGYDYLESLESFRRGEFSVQDVSSMMVCELAALKAGDTVIDVCAAPGGKAINAAERLNGTGSVEARDLTEYKAEMIRENIRRTGLTNIKAVCRDALVFDADSVEKADVLIADLPCSGLGVLGKKTDLKYKVTPEGARELSELQREILTQVQSYVKYGGVLMYSTCTVNPAENLENVHWFLEHFPEYTLTDIQEELCEELKSYVQEQGCIQLLPGVHKSDGFFIARFERTGQK